VYSRGERGGDMMKINKNMIIAITITFCFIAAMFMAIPIRSQPSGQYDPWLDINDDGRINMDEIVASTTAFGATGDPTKNVTVTNWPSSFGGPNSEVITVCQNYTFSEQTPGDGLMLPYCVNVQNYKYIDIYLAYINYGPDPGPPGGEHISIDSYASCSNITGHTYSSMTTYYQVSGPIWQTQASDDFPITGPEVQVYIRNISAQSIQFTIMLYCHN
jgi:hypothetical protein